MVSEVVWTPLSVSAVKGRAVLMMTCVLESLCLTLVLLSSFVHILTFGSLFKSLFLHLAVVQVWVGTFVLSVYLYRRWFLAALVKTCSVGVDVGVAILDCSGVRLGRVVCLQRWLLWLSCFRDFL